MSKIDNSVFDDPKFILLVRQGLIDRGQISIYKRAIKKVEDGKLPTSKELLILNDLITKLAGFTTSDNTTYQRARKMAKEETQMRSSNDWESIVELTAQLLEKQGPCWKGYKKVPGKKDFEDGSCVKEGETDSGHSDKEIRMAQGIAFDKRYKGGNMTGAVKAMDKMKPGISDHPKVKSALQRANEGLSRAMYEAYLDSLDEAGYMDPPKTREQFEKRFPNLSYEDYLSISGLEEKAYVSTTSPDLGRKGSHDVVGKDGKVIKSYPFNKQGQSDANNHLSRLKETEEMDEQKNYHPGYDPNNKYTHHLFLAKPPVKVPEPSAAEKARRAKVTADNKKRSAELANRDGGKADWLAKNSKNNESVEVTEDDIEERTNDRYNDVERVKIRKRQKEKRINRKPSMLARDADNPNLKAQRNKLAKIKNAIPDDPNQDDKELDENYFTSLDILIESAGDNYSLSDSVKDVISDSFNLYFKAQAFHWNVEGERFNELHELFGDVYESTYASVDSFAEQLRTLDSKAPSSLKEILDRTIIEDENVTNAVQMIAALEEANADMIQSLYVTHKIATRDNNLAITNYVEERIQAHEKFGWMLRSSMPETVAEQTRVNKQQISEHYATMISRTILK